MARITQSNNFSRPLVSPPLGFKLIAVRQIANGKNWKVTYSASDSRARESSFRINKKVRECLINNCKWVIDWSYETAQIYEITFKVGIKKYIYVMRLLVNISVGLRDLFLWLMIY
jgi:hypothetical protein